MLLGMTGKAHWNTESIISYAFAYITYFRNRTNMTTLNFGIVATYHAWKRSYELLMLNRMNYVCLPNLHYLYFFAFFFAVLATDKAIATDCACDLPRFISRLIFLLIDFLD